MFSHSLATETGAMRPGLISGRYPERGDQEPSLMDRSVTALQGFAGRINTKRQGKLKNIVAAINRQEENLTQLSKEQLDSDLAQLRSHFRSHGLTEELCIQSFALIRELATRTLQQRHYDVQLIGGWIILHGQLAEMETGEGALA